VWSAPAAAEVRERGTCVSVVRGKVRVTTPAVVLEVTGGESFCSDEGVRPIAPAIEQALDRHEAVITARAVEPVPAVPARPLTPAIAPDRIPPPAATLTTVPDRARDRARRLISPDGPTRLGARRIEAPRLAVAASRRR
jgi:hypothetical protein